MNNVIYVRRFEWLLFTHFIYWIICNGLVLQVVQDQKCQK